MTNEDWTQLAQQLTPEQKDKLIGVLFGPEEDWSEVGCEIVLKLYGANPKPDLVAARDIVRNIVREKQDRHENIEQKLLNLLDELEKDADDFLRQGQ
ncbi:MAG: hypothetical protein QOG23_3746 [Blastocatellia bacterium]|jgi:hypothetical protein|nr:hypothetical protein [Blastocatellia bacterium]